MIVSPPRFSVSHAVSASALPTGTSQSETELRPSLGMAGCWVVVVCLVGGLWGWVVGGDGVGPLFLSRGTTHTGSRRDAAAHGARKRYK